MAVWLRILLCLVLSLASTAVYILLAETHVVRLIEDRYYGPRQIGLIQERLGAVLQELRRYHEENLGRLEQLGKEPSIRDAWRPVQPRATIEAREAAVAALLARYYGQTVLQILDPPRRRLDYSSSRADVLNQEANRIVYRNPQQLDPPLFSGVLDPEFRGVYFDERRRMIGYLVPIRDSANIDVGVLHLLVSQDDLGQLLFQKRLHGSVGALSLYGTTTIVLHQTRYPGWDELERRLREVLAADSLPELTKLSFEGDSAVLVALQRPEGKAGLVANPETVFLPVVFRYLIQAVLGGSLFLLFLILTGAKADPELVFRLRLKALKIQILQEILRSGEDFTAEKLVGELRKNGPLWKRSLRKALGTVPAKYRKNLEEMIDRSWEEVIAVLEPKALPAGATLDVTRLENLLRQALNRLQAGLPTSGVIEQAMTKAVPSTAATARPVAPPQRPTGDAAEVEELEEVPEAEAVEELEEITEAEPVEELEEVAEAEPVEELEEVTEAGGGVREAEAVEELEEVAEAEPVEELEEVTEVSGGVREAEAVEELEELSEEAPTGEGPPAHVGGPPREASMAEPLEELERAQTRGDRTGDLVPLEEEPSLFQGKSWLCSPEAVSETLGAADSVEELEAVERYEEDRFIEHFGPVQLTALYQPIEADPFEDEDGLPVLRESYLKTPHRARDPGLATLVARLVGEEEFVIEDEDAEQPRYWSWTPRGFDFEEFLTAYPLGEVGIFKAMVDLSREFSCFAAALFEQKGRALLAEYSVGFTPKGKSQLTIPVGSALYKNYLAKGGITIMETHGLPASFLNRLLDQRDHGLVKTIIFLPLFFRETTAWLLLLSMQRRKDWLSVLKPRVFSSRHASLIPALSMNEAL